MAMPDRRTLTVLGLLIASMTLTSALLLAFEPRPAGRTPIALQAVQETGDRLEKQLTANVVQEKTSQWKTIAIHFSGTAFGSARSLTQLHDRMGLNGLAYHAVIGNGNGGLEDGAVEFSPRWQKQALGISHQAGIRNVPGAIDICLIGDCNRRPLTDSQMRELVNLVQKLQQRYQIPPERVVHFTDASSGRGRLFQVAWFQQQLLSPTAYAPASAE